jgi:hypothetical protein
MARHLRIRHIVSNGGKHAYDVIDAICGLNPDGTHWTLTREQAVSQIEDRISSFYVESRGGQRLDVVVAMDLRANKYLKTVSTGEPSDELLFLPNCTHIAHVEIAHARRATA